MLQIKREDFRILKNPLPQDRLNKIRKGDLIKAEMTIGLPIVITLLVEKVNENDIYGSVIKHNAGTSNIGKQLKALSGLSVPENAILDIYNN